MSLWQRYMQQTVDPQNIHALVRFRQWAMKSSQIRRYHWLDSPYGSALNLSLFWFAEETGYTATFLCSPWKCWGSPSPWIMVVKCQQTKGSAKVSKIPSQHIPVDVFSYGHKTGLFVIVLSSIALRLRWFRCDAHKFRAAEPPLGSSAVWQKVTCRNKDFSPLHVKIRSTFWLEIIHQAIGCRSVWLVKATWLLRALTAARSARIKFRCSSTTCTCYLESKTVCLSMFYAVPVP